MRKRKPKSGRRDIHGRGRRDGERSEGRECCERRGRGAIDDISRRIIYPLDSKRSRVGKMVVEITCDVFRAEIIETTEVDLVRGWGVDI